MSKLSSFCLDSYSGLLLQARGLIPLDAFFPSSVLSRLTEGTGALWLWIPS
jgi:hypothetical protein